MNLNDDYSRSLTEAKTTSIKGRILESNDKYIIVTWCNCVQHDPPDNPCPCYEDTKLIIDKSDIVGDIVTIESQEKDKLSEFRVKSDANIIREEKTVVKANSIIGVLTLPIGVGLLCKKFPQLCKDKEGMIKLAMSTLNTNGIIGYPDPFKDILCKLLPEYCRGKGDGKDDEEGVLYFGFLVGVVAGLVLSKVIDKVIEEVID